MTPEQRLEGFRKFVAERPDEPFPRYSLAMQLRSMGKHEEAVAEFRELGRRAPDYVPTWLMLGQALEAVGRGSDAAQAYRDGIAAATRQANHHARSELEDALERVSAQGS
jgi:predicted Zn-dependent protease